MFYNKNLIMCNNVIILGFGAVRVSKFRKYKV